MESKNSYLKVIVLIFLFFSQIFSQNIYKFPVLDTLYIGGGCTLPIIKSIKIENGTSSMDTIKIEPDWNTSFWGKDSSGNKLYYPNFLFMVEDSVRSYNYKLYLLRKDTLSSQNIFIPFDSNYTIESNQFILKLFLYDIITDSLVDSISQFCKTEIGVGIDKHPKNKITNSYFELYSNYPNPFNAETRITYKIFKKSFVTLSIYDINGELLETLFSEEKPIGIYSTIWKADKYGSGTYFIKIRASGFEDVKKCLLIK